MSALADKAWQWLGRELDNWADAGAQVSFWWRDDDAIEASPALTRLLALSDAHAVPLALAVIPARSQPGLAESLRDRHRVSVLQHGYAHQNHALPGQRKLELGGNLAPAEAERELIQGRRILERQFGESFHPVLVPPWNRIDPALLARLPAIGLRGLSTMKVRKQAFPAAKLLQVNTHLDPINWRHDRGFVGVYPAIAILIQHLIARRLAYRDVDEPSGILTHHLVQNQAVWRFCDQLFEFLNCHPAVAWRDAHTIWQ